MTPMMLAISPEERSICDMASMARLTISPDRSALSRACATSCPASSARSDESLTAVVTSSSAAAVSSTEAACCSVRLERSLAAERISRAPASMLRALSPTSRSAFCSLEGGVEVLAQFVEMGGKCLVEPHFQIAVRKRLEPLRKFVDGKLHSAASRAFCSSRALRSFSETERPSSAARSRLMRSMAFCLKTSTAAAISPISSRRSAKGIGDVLSPPASRDIEPVMWVIGRATRIMAI